MRSHMLTHPFDVINGKFITVLCGQGMWWFSAPYSCQWESGTGCLAGVWVIFVAQGKGLGSLDKGLFGVG